MQSGYVDEDKPVFEEEALEATIPNLGPHYEVYDIPPTPPPQSPASIGIRDPVNTILFDSLDPTHRLINAYTSHTEAFLSDRAGVQSPARIKSMEETSSTHAAHAFAPPAVPGATQSETLAEQSPSSNVELAVKALEVTDKANADETTARRVSRKSSPPPNTRVDSAQSAEEVLPPPVKSRAGARSPLKLQTSQSAPEARTALIQNDTITASPTLRKHVISLPEDNQNTLPAVQPTSPIQERESAGSPTTKLPSFQQFTGRLNQLNELAEVASTVGPVKQLPPHSRNNSLSYSSTTAPSPRLPYHTYTPNVQTSPVNPYPYSTSTARSPTSTISEMTHTAYGSPQQYSLPTAYFTNRRRSSAATDFAPPYQIPPLPSGTSSGESQGHAGSSTEGYSTAHTTPIDAAQAVNGETPRPMPILPPPPGMPQNVVVMNGGFKCDYPDCNAVPFQTQYLLSSHKNVHSSQRPYFCAVADCPRSEGGKGFKRKNEMIRHGLVHNSPGYVCPFCPDREHRYPRPDNLQRHVRAHHMEKDRDDPTLREVLAQRIEGIGKQRRRRTNAHGNTSPN